MAVCKNGREKKVLGRVQVPAVIDATSVEPLHSRPRSELAALSGAQELSEIWQCFHHSLLTIRVVEAYQMHLGSPFLPVDVGNVLVMKGDGDLHPCKRGMPTNAAPAGLVLTPLLLSLLLIGNPVVRPTRGSW